MVINHLLTGMILQVDIKSYFLRISVSLDCHEKKKSP